MNECKQCGKHIPNQDNRADRYKTKFCSRSCAATFNNNLRIYSTSITSSICMHCKKEFDAYRSSERKFCSKKCTGLHSKLNNIKTLKECILTNTDPGQVNISPAYKEVILDRDGHKCVECGQGEMWNNKPLTLQIDHIDGDSDNNTPSNLRSLCLHCHSQTITYGSKNTRKLNSKRSKRYNKFFK